MNYEDLTVEELRQKLMETDMNRQNIERMLKERKRESRGEMLQKLNELMQSYGFEPNEIMKPKRTRRKKRKISMKTSFTQYVDPDNPNNTYSRGVLPPWFKEKMIKLGFDPENKDDRERFRAKHMRKIQVERNI